MDSNYITNDNSLSFYTQKPTDSYELDFNKIKTVEDCVLLIKTMLCGFGNGHEPKITIGNTSYLYEQMKHLAKDKEKKCE